MADSGALRVRRARMHKAGDHSLCRRCAVVRDGAAVTLAAVPDAPGLDALEELRALAGLLAAAYRADPGNALLARELRMTLQALMAGAGKADGDLTRFLAALGES